MCYPSTTCCSYAGSCPVLRVRVQSDLEYSKFARWSETRPAQGAVCVLQTKFDQRNQSSAAGWVSCSSVQSDEFGVIQCPLCGLQVRQRAHRLPSRRGVSAWHHHQYGSRLRRIEQSAAAGTRWSIRHSTHGGQRCW